MSYHRHHVLLIVLVHHDALVLLKHHPAACHICPDLFHFTAVAWATNMNCKSRLLMACYILVLQSQADAQENVEDQYGCYISRPHADATGRCMSQVLAQ